MLHQHDLITLEPQLSVPRGDSAEVNFKVKKTYVCVEKWF